MTTSSSSFFWRSKLGHNYPKEEIERDEKKHKAELDRLRNLPENKYCADCGTNGTVWASVNLGVFLCMKCGAHHRGMGTHISLPKGCVGTYLWGPDEVERMAAMGNAKAKLVYGGDDCRPRKDAPDSEWFRFIVNKYQHGKFKPTQNSSNSQLSPTTTVAPTSTTTTSSPRKSFAKHHSPLSSPKSSAARPMVDWAHFAEEPEGLDPQQYGVVSPTVAKSKTTKTAIADKGVCKMPGFTHFQNPAAESRSPVSSPSVKPKPTTRQKNDRDADFFSQFGL